MLERIKIEKLFGSYDYDIHLNDERVTIVTGPNGYGKTTVLRIINAFANRNFFLFLILKYCSMTLTFSDNTSTEIVKVNADDDSCSHSQIIIRNSTTGQEERFPDEKWLKSLRRVYGGDHILQQGDMVFQYLSDHLEFSNEFIPSLQRKLRISADPLRGIADRLSMREIRMLSELHTQFASLPAYPAYLIQEQRLHFLGSLVSFDEERPVVYKTIDAYALDLKKRIADVSMEYASKTQALESSFPQRLFAQRNRMTGDAFHSTMQAISDKQRQLNEFGLYDVLPNPEEVRFENDNARTLQLYFDDIREKLTVFDDILGRLNIFNQILQRLILPNKKIVFSKETGFHFRTMDSNEEIPRRLLSSGEQHQVAMWYELLFKVPKHSLVLIDEPEISLHISWQDSYIKNLLEILEIQDIHVVVATDSAQIIGPYWYLVHDLYEDQHKVEA